MSQKQLQQGQPIPEANSTISSIVQCVQDTYGVAADYARQKRDEFAEATQARLETLDRELARLDHQAGEAGTAVQERWRAMQSILMRRRNFAWKKFQELKGHAVDAWRDLGGRVDDARQDLSSAIAVARDRFRLPK